MFRMLPAALVTSGLQFGSIPAYEWWEGDVRGVLGGDLGSSSPTSFKCWISISMKV